MDDILSLIWWSNSVLLTCTLSLLVASRSLILFTISFFSYFTNLLSLIFLPIFICFSIKFLACIKLTINEAYSYFFSYWFLCYCVTCIFLRNFSLYSTSCYLSTNSFLRCFSSRFNAKKTWRFLSSSNFYSVWIIFVISLSLFTSSLFSMTSWSCAIENNIFC